MADSLYVMTFTADDVDWTKIGRAADVEIRQRQIQANKPFAVRLVKEYPGQGEHEIQVLNQLARLASHGERMRDWYRVEPGPVVGLIDEILRTAAMEPAPTEASDRAARRMVMKTSYYPRGQLDRLKRLAKEINVTEAEILREALEFRLMQADL